MVRPGGAIYFVKKVPIPILEPLFGVVVFINPVCHRLKPVGWLVMVDAKRNRT
jgi:hypothetical protein